MLIRHSFDSRFILKIRELSEKYGTKMLELDGIGPDTLDINLNTQAFLNNNGGPTSDISIDSNANVDDRSTISLETEVNKPLLRLNSYYNIWKSVLDDPELGIKRANKLIEMAVNGTFRCHDLHLWFKPYCYAFSLGENVTNGLTFVNTVKIGRPKHVTSFINHVIQFIAYTSNQIAGAAAFPDFFVYLDWFCRNDWCEDYLEHEEYRRILNQELESFIFSLAWPFRSGGQSSFVNLSMFDKPFLISLFKDLKYPDFSGINLESIYNLQTFYMKKFVNMSKEQTFTFPVNTATFHVNEKGEIQDEKFLDLISELNAINGTFNIYCGPLGRLSSCCRLISDLNKVYTNSFGAGGVSIGSHRVVTLNLPHLAFESEGDIEKFIHSVRYATLGAQDILYKHRQLLEDLIEKKKLPLYNNNYMHLSKQFSTVGFLGLYEALEILGFNMNDRKTWVEFGVKVLDEINTLNTEKADKTKTIWNMEAVPGETAAYVFAKKDKLLFNNTHEIYSNQYLPLWENRDIEDRIQIAGKFDKLCSGGAIAHINSSESLTKDQMKLLINFAATSGVIYFAVNMAQCRCQTCGKLFIGKFEKSPCHNADVDKYLRVVGFLTPVKNWSPERRDEYNLRQFYNEGAFKKDLTISASSSVIPVIPE